MEQIDYQMVSTENEYFIALNVEIKYLFPEKYKQNNSNKFY